MIDERLTGGLAVIVSQLPPLIQRLLDPNSDQAARHTRYQLFAALSQFSSPTKSRGLCCQLLNGTIC